MANAKHQISPTTRMLTEGAILIALALILGLLKLYEFPNGGAVSLEMLPLFLFCVRWGVGKGLLACLAFSVLQIFVQSAVGWGWVSMLLDYIVAFTVIAFAGLARGRKNGIFWGTVIGSLCRFLVHFISGITVYRIVAPTKLLGTTWDNPWLYSAVYNGTYMGIDMILCLVVFALLMKPMHQFLTGEDLR